MSGQSFEVGNAQQFALVCHLLRETCLERGQLSIGIDTLAKTQQDAFSKPIVETMNTLSSNIQTLRKLSILKVREHMTGKAESVCEGLGLPKVVLAQVTYQTLADELICMRMQGDANHM